MKLIDETGAYDFYCNGYRYFHDIEKTEAEYQRICDIPNKRQFYGQDVIEFDSVTEINTTIQKLTALRDTVNGAHLKDNHVQKEFGNNGQYYNRRFY